ncbi:hypothetical protein HG536_0G02660 [Torulaspora globosa]|uniref:Uncharacterized protein n=1 Tax=Torulaspora globosa TaxID=48254 RepID=A0A7G3ZLL9_9SACH|nr:uncharacterized protein HG536_0G02660 [Torulaspora globosa]QLL34405.1 hypothetical protein HG536_0G02660 [Torulaspora globosa]
MQTLATRSVMYPALRVKFDSRIVLSNIRSYGLRRLLPVQHFGTANLSAKRNSLAERQVVSSSRFPRIPSYSNNVSMLHIGLARKRFFHNTSSREIFFSFKGGRPLYKIYRISPVMLFFAGVGFFVLAFAVIPIVFTFFLPLFIGTVVVFQFNKWRRNVMLREIIGSLKRSTMHVKYKTVRALHIKGLENVLKVEQQSSESLKDVLKRFNVALESQIDRSSVADADRLSGFINDRLLEAVENDEKGVRSFFLGNDVNSWVSDNYELELDTKQIKTNGRVLGDDVLIVLTFPLYLKSTSHGRKQLANVSLVISHKSPEGALNAPFPFQLLSMNNEECQMVLSIRPLSVLSTRQFILTSPGRSGDWYSKYEVRQTPDNHTEYTIRRNE